MGRGRREQKIIDFYGIFGGQEIDIGFNIENTAPIAMGKPMVENKRTYELPKKIYAGLPGGQWERYPSIVVKKVTEGFETTFLRRASWQGKWGPKTIHSPKLDNQFIRNAKKAGLTVRKYRRTRP
jgi:hypothetical protein